MMKMRPRIGDGERRLLVGGAGRGGCAPLNATWPLGGLSVPAD